VRAHTVEEVLTAGLKKHSIAQHRTLRVSDASFVELSIRCFR
jgi:hypothetical protein